MLFNCHSWRKEMNQNHLLQFVNVSMGFNGRHLFKDFNLTVDNNEVVGLTGQSGSGKSTLLRIAVDLMSPLSGEVYVLGRPVSDWDPRNLRRNVILVLQESQMFPNTVRDNLSWGLMIHNETVDDDSLLKILEEVKLTSIDLDDDASNLSGGEKQRIAIARALLMKPKALLLDEPTASLDTTSALAVEEVLDELIESHRIGILMVTHNIDQAKRFASRVVDIHGGTDE
ncbi:ATP-binding cassette domain-containing protein [Candidatus Thorarchaeota archaeon]|nr:MAG: ATP-binding cassette domain-containing protein [Candidatus Thorarchaeota archaeon]